MIPVAGVCAVLGLLAVITEFRHQPSPDVAWLLEAARRVLHGARFGSEVVEVNPPLIVWLKMGVVWAAEGLGLDALLLYRILVMLAAIGSLALWWHLLGRGAGLRPRPWVLAVAAMVLFNLPREGFGQREHLALILLLPLTALVALRRDATGVPAGMALPVGALAAVGSSFKPHFVLVPLGLLGYLLVTRRLRALRLPELAAGVGLLVVYAVAVWTLTPEYVRLVFGMGDLYNTYLHNNLLNTLLVGVVTPVPLFTMAAYAALRRGRRDPLAAALLLLMAGFLLSALLQLKGWEYHYYPALAGAAVLQAVLLDRVGSESLPGVRQVYRALGWVALGVAAGLSAVNVGQRLVAPPGSSNADPSFRELVPVVRALARRDRVMVLSTNIAAAFPLLSAAGATGATRYPSLWVLAALYHDRLWLVRGPLVLRPPEERGWRERLIQEQVLEDLIRCAPRLVIVPVLDPSADASAGAPRFDYLWYFMGDPRFRAAFRAYRYTATVGRYHLFQRASPVLPSAAGLGGCPVPLPTGVG